MNSSRRGIGRSLLAAVVVVVVAFAGVAFLIFSSNTVAPNSSVCSSTAAGQTPVQVSIYSGASSLSDAPGYSPDNITLVIGVNNTVTFTNNDSVHHTVTSTSAPSGGSFNSGNMNPGAACTHTFTVAGDYAYYCAYHSWMTGTITVKAT